MIETLSPDSLEEVASEQTYYVNNLAEVNKNNDVISTQDIYNENGLLVARKGMHINHDVASRIVQQKLLQPLEEQVEFDNSLNDSKLNDDFHSLLIKYPDMMMIHCAHDFQPILDSLLVSIGRYPILLQELTVMKECLPEQYEKALFCSLLSALISSKMSMERDLIKVSFLAGLAHDIGLLHISPDILHKKEKLTPADWRAIQSHVVIGHLLLKKIDGGNSRAAKAVLQHHERCDGTGYPGGKTDMHLDVMGQIIGMADSLQAIRVNQFSKCGRNLRDAAPYLHMNSHTHFLNVYNATWSILQSSGLSPSHINTFRNIESLIDHLFVQANKLNNIAMLLDQEMDLDGLKAKSDSFDKLLKVATPVLRMITSSGVANADIVEWLENLKSHADESELPHLTELELMQNELFWQLKKVCKVIQSYDSNNTDVSDSHSRVQLSILAIQIEMFCLGNR